MAEAVAAALADIAFEAGASTLGAYLTFYGATTLEAIAAVSAVATLREDQRRAQSRQRDAYNASLKDRYTMVRSATEPRSFVLGRQRVSGPLAYIGSYGANREHLVMAIILAAHQCDAVEAIYFDDELVTLSGTDVVAVNRRDLFTLTSTGDTFTLTSEPAAGTVAAVVAYGTTEVSLGVSVAGSDVTVSGGTSGQTGTVTITYQPAQSPWISKPIIDATESVSLNGSGTGSVTLAHTPISGSVHVVYSTGGSLENESQTSLDAYTGVAGAVVTVTAAPVTSATATVSYQYQTTTASKARVRSYLGAPGQTADAAMVAALPGTWTSSHTMTGLCYLVVEADFDPDAFPNGLPNVSAIVRGALCYDPRDASTAWTENPALLARYVATHALLGRLPSECIDDTSIAVAANVCDTSTSYVVDGRTYVRPLYTAGLVTNTRQRPLDAIDDLVKAMAGRRVVAGGVLRLRAGAYVSPLQTLDDSWLADAAPVQVQSGTARADLMNDISGRFADEMHDYKEIDYPRVFSDTYESADGANLPQDMPFNAVTFSGQCQQVAATIMREARMGLQVVLTCNMKAWRVEVFDTLYVTLARFGWVNQVFEVLNVSWTLDGGIQLTLKATDPSVFAMGTSFDATALPPNTLFPSPFQIPSITGLACASGTGQLLKQADGTVLTRIAVTWDAITDALVLADGGVEVRYGLATTAEDTWESVVAERAQSLVYLSKNVRDGLFYLVKARAFNALVKGAWCAPELHRVVGKSATPGTVAGFTSSVSKGRIAWSWTPNADADYGYTEVRSADSNWGSTSSLPLFRGKASAWQEVVTSAATYTRYARHFDNSGNYSASSSSRAQVVAAADLLQNGASARVSYASVAIGTSPSSSPDPSTVSGDNLPANNTWGMSETWSTTLPTVSAGYQLYVSNGVFDPLTNQTSWVKPYASSVVQSSFSVSLSGTYSKSVGGGTSGAQVIGTPTVTPTGGRGTISYAWTITTQGNDLDNSDFLYLTGSLTASSCGLSGYLSTTSPQNIYGTVTVVATDADGRTATASHTALLTHT